MSLLVAATNQLPPGSGRPAGDGALSRDPQQQADGRDRHSTADTDRDGIDIQDRQRWATALRSARLSQLLWDRGVYIIASC